MAMSSSGGGRSSRRGRRKTQRMSEINVTPMVDVMLVLLVVFMVAAPLMTTGIPLDLPQGGNQVLNDASKSLRISVSPEGEVYLGEDPVDMSLLVSRVVAMRQANPELGVVISGDTNAAYGAVMGVMQALKDAGVEKVGLETGTRHTTPSKSSTKDNKG